MWTIATIDFLKMMMNIRCIIFDFGNVIGFFDRAKAAAQLAKMSTCEADFILDNLVNNPGEMAFERGEHDSFEQVKRLQKQFGLSGTPEQITVAYSDMFTPNREVVGLIPILKPTYQLVLLSNTNQLHFEHLLGQFSDTLGYFDYHVLSFETGYRKPEAGIYRHLLNRVGRNSEECLLIDDLQENINSARKMGFQGLVYQPNHKLAPTLENHGVSLGLNTERMA